MNMLDGTKRTIIYIKRNMGAIMRFEIIYKLITFVIFFPLLEKTERLSLRLAGVYYLSNFNLRLVLKSPFVWIMFVLVLLAVAVMISVEFFGLSYAACASYHDKRISARAMLICGVRKCGVIFRPYNWLFLFYVFLILPVADLYEVFTAASNFSVPGYLIERLTRDDRYYPYIYTAIVILAFMTFCLIYVIPLMMVKNQRFLMAARTSISYTLGRMPRILIRAAIWFAMIAGVFAGAYCVLLLIVKLVVMWLEPSMADTVLKNPGVTLVCQSIVLLIFTWFITPLILTRIQTGFYMLSEDKGDKTGPFDEKAGKAADNIFLRVMVFALIAVCLFFFVPERYGQLKTALLYGGRDTMIMAHRGDSADAPENTIPAFRKAIENGADAAELDVQLTRDGTVIVLHDPSLKRTAGLDKKVWQVTYDQIKDLDNGSFYSDTYQFTRIPTLDQVLKVCKGKLYLNIEIKRTGHDSGIVEKTLEIIEANQYENDCDITSFDYATLSQVKRLNPKIYTVYTTTVGGGALARLKDANAFSVDSNFVTPGFVQYMKKKNKGIFVWTVNSGVTMNRMIDMNVDAIITDNVRLAGTARRRNKGVVGAMRRIQRVLLAF
ncbi:MAG: glycerophosphodiester phosphodiesterase family protein [Lachnospiraceae bacterium]|nr:glycerophosphodiester phosphodiesterase family protein [Lachnospiraceae bacterium]